MELNCDWEASVGIKNDLSTDNAEKPEQLESSSRWRTNELTKNAVYKTRLSIWWGYSRRACAGRHVLKL